MGRFSRISGRHAEGPPAWMQQKFVWLSKISIWERPVDTLRSSYPSGSEKGSGILKHDYVVIELASSNYSFVVEKVDKPVKGGILNCDYVIYRSGGRAIGSSRRKRVDLKGARVQVENLKSILEAGGHEYALLSANCWKYANDTAAEVIELCANAANLRKTERESLIADLQDLKTVERIMPRDAFRILYNPWDPRNVVTVGTLKIRSMCGGTKYKVFHKVARLISRAKDSKNKMLSRVGRTPRR